MFERRGPQIESAETYINTGILFEDGYRNNSEALVNYEKALEVYEKASVSVSSQKVVELHHNIQRVKNKLMNPSSLSPPKAENEDQVEENRPSEASEANIHIDMDEKEENIINDSMRLRLSKTAKERNDGQLTEQVKAVVTSSRDLIIQIENDLKKRIESEDN
ncbi:unnamed protein product, partial [Didymodactylos carnosus]